MDAQIEKAREIVVPDWVHEIVDTLRPYLSTANPPVPVGADPEIYGASDRDRAMVVHMHNSESIKTLNVLTDGKFVGKDRGFRGADGETFLRRVEDFNYIVVENGIRKDGHEKIEYTIYVRNPLLLRQLRQSLGLR